jgi:hypothetical protein
MGKTFSTGLLTNGIWQDASNNIGIGGSPSGSYKFEVTGTTKTSDTIRILTGANSTDISYAVGKEMSSNNAAFFGWRFNSGGTPYGFISVFGTSGRFSLMPDGGNVGIGTSSPNFILQVNKSDGGASVTQYTNADTGTASSNGLLCGIDSGEDGLFFHQGAKALRFGTSDTERMRIGSQGNVGIGQVNATDVRLFVRSAGSGAATYNIYSRDVNAVDLFVIRDDGYGYLKAAAWAYGSDKRIKENINYIETGLDKILALKPARFDYIGGVKNNIGWIAQDVQEVIPEAVNTISEENDQLTLKSDFIVPYLVKAIQELKAEIEELKNK